MTDHQPLLLNIQNHLEQLNTLLRSSQIFQLSQDNNQTPSLVALQAQADRLQTQYAKLCDKLIPNND